MQRKHVIRLLLVVAVVGAAIGGGAMLRSGEGTVAPTHVDPQPFERVAWLGGNARTRIGMAKDLATSRSLVGQSSGQLVTMLGTPARNDAQSVEWYLGQRQSPASLMFPYEEYLSVRLDENGNASDALVESRD